MKISDIYLLRRKLIDLHHILAEWESNWNCELFRINSRFVFCLFIVNVHFWILNLGCYFSVLVRIWWCICYWIECFCFAIHFGYLVCLFISFNLGFIYFPSFFCHSFTIHNDWQWWQKAAIEWMNEWWMVNEITSHHIGECDGIVE